MNELLLEKLQHTLEQEMPICKAMGIVARSWDGSQLMMEMPLEPNKNHQYSAFAGSLNALCTITGWGAVFLLLEVEGLSGNIVIRRSNIRYLRPVRAAKFYARSLLVPEEDLQFFYELQRSKGRTKVDVATEIADADGPFVTFKGSYVVQD